MRIAIWHNLPSGGGKRALHDQVQGLVDLGHHVEIWCPPSADERFLPTDTYARRHVIDLPPFPQRAAHWLGRYLGINKSIEAEMQLMEAHCKACVEEIEARDFDVILAHPCRFFRVSPMAKFARRLPTVIYLAEPFRELYEAMPRLVWEAPKPITRGFSRGLWKAFFRDLVHTHERRIQVREEAAWLRCFRKILVNSQFSRESLLRTYGLDSRVCYLGIAPSFHPAGSSKQKYVVGLGNIHGNKRIELAIEAVGKMPVAERPPLMWIGNFCNQSYLTEMETLARARGVTLTPRVMISDTELRDAVEKAAAMVYTSYLEPFGYAPLEANACGTGVVAIAEGGVRESIVDNVNGFLVPDSDPEAFAVLLGRFVNDLEFARSFGEKAQHHVEVNWALSDATARLEAELTSVCNRSEWVMEPAAGAC